MEVGFIAHLALCDLYLFCSLRG